MECPFHSGNESVSSCMQCGTPICPLCVSETNQVLLCLDCHRARVNELSAVLDASSAQKAAERRKKEPKPAVKGRKGRAEAAPPPEARPAFKLGAEASIWEREEIVGALEEEPSRAVAASAPGAAVEEAAPGEAPLSKKELARLKKEEAKRLKMERKLAKKGAAVEEAAPGEAPSAAEEVFEPLLPEPAPSVEVTEETPAPEPPAAELEVHEEKPASPLPDLPLDLIGEKEKEGVRLPRLDDRLEFLPPVEEKEGPPPGSEPPEGFFD